jgi:hypothetical protein
MSHWVLVGKHLAEPNSYHTDDLYKVDRFTRAGYISIAIILRIVQLFTTEIDSINHVLIISISLLPFIWSIGALPSIRIAFVLLIERINVDLFGSTPTYSKHKSMIIFLEKLTIVIISNLIINTKYPLPAFLLISVSGCIFSNRNVLDCIALKFNPDLKAKFPLYFIDDRERSLMQRIGSFIVIIIYVFITLGISIFILATYSTGIHPYQNVLAYFISCCFLVLKLSREFQQLYIPSSIPIFMNPISFSPEPLKIVFGYIHMFATFVTPLFTVAYICTRSMQILSSTPQIWDIIMLTRLFGVVWSFQEGTNTDCNILLVLEYIQIPSFDLIGFPTKLLIISLIKNSVFRFLAKFKFWIILLKHFLFYKKERHSNWVLVFLLSLIISPITILISSILNTPSVPFLGLPFLIISFPRPEKYWESIDREYFGGKEATLYTSMASTLLANISQAMRSGKLPSLSIGDCMLVRFESRILFMRAVESWSDGISIIITATELEPTSCHALEGVVVDDVLDVLTTRKSKVINQNIIHSVVPVGRITTTGYSESLQITTGIFDTSNLTAKFPTLFFKILCFYIVENLDIQSVLTYTNIPVQDNIVLQIKSGFPVDFFNLVKKRSAKYQERLRYVDQTLLPQIESSLMSLITTFYIIMLGSTHSQTNVQLTTNMLFEIYKGQVSYAVQHDLRSWFFDIKRKNLRILCIESFRYSVKYLYDCLVLDDPIPDNQGLYNDMLEIISNWSVVVEESEQMALDPTEPAVKLQKSLQERMMGIFVLGMKKNGGPLNIRILSKRNDCVVKLATMNGESIKGMWANLLYELLYLTNDDEERYSIQAHKVFYSSLALITKFDHANCPGTIWLSIMAFCSKNR